jgi:hypothetical protein
VERSAQILRAFVASPGDTAEERRIVGQVVSDINRLNGRSEGFRIDLLLWEEDSYPDAGTDAQEVINQQIGDYEIFIGLMSTRFGSPTGRANSGTEEEFERAFEKHIRNPGTIKILFYFRDATVKLSQVDLYQALQIQRFRDRISKLGALYYVYDGLEDFGRRLSSHLLQAARDVILKDKALSGSSSAAKASNQISTIDLPDWQAVTSMISPQRASYREVPLERYSCPSFSLRGSLQSDSPYFRFGFKLFTSSGRLFGEATVHSEDNNLVVHLGKNPDKSRLFLTSYRNGLRHEANVPILDYDPPRELSIDISVGADDFCKLAVDLREVYQVHISPAIKKRLIIVAWGDEYEYDVHFRNVKLLCG